MTRKPITTRVIGAMKHRYLCLAYAAGKAVCKMHKYAWNRSEFTGLRQFRYGYEDEMEVPEGRTRTMQWPRGKD